MRRIVASAASAAALARGFAAIREELGVPAGFGPEVEEAAGEAARRGPLPAERDDLRGLPFVTLDPAGSRDLDQALHLEADGDGVRLRYAIADVGAWVDPGGPVAAEAWRRGQTLYSPDGRAPLYPPVLSEGAASLLPDVERPAVVFDLRVDGAGAVTGTTVRRALVRSRRRLAYGEPDAAAVPHLARAGAILDAAAVRRGATRVDLPGQEVVPVEGGDGWALRLEARRPEEDWNAQLSLAANVAAARRMIDAGVGLLRVMAGADPAALDAARGVVRALGIPWPDDEPAAALAARLPLDDPRGVAAGEALRRALGGAAYAAVPAPGAGAHHAAVGSPYAHATAPLRRLADRHVLDLLVDLHAGVPLDQTSRSRFVELERPMNRSDAVAGRLNGACVDLVEAAVLRTRVGQTFDAVVTGRTGAGVRVQLRDPAVRVTLEGHAAEPGSRLVVRVVEADVERRRVRVAPA